MGRKLGSGRHGVKVARAVGAWDAGGRAAGARRMVNSSRMPNPRCHPPRAHARAVALFCALLVALTVAVPRAAHATSWTWGDTLTTILRPLPNLPALVRQTDTLTVWAGGPSTITGWQANILFGTIELPLLPVGGGYRAIRGRWELQFTVPQIVGVGTA